MVLDAILAYLHDEQRRIRRLVIIEVHLAALIPRSR